MEQGALVTRSHLGGRKGSLLGALVFANFATVGLGLPLGGEGGKFSISNIAPVLFVLFALVLFFREKDRLNRAFVWFFVLFNLSALLSFAVFLVRFQWTPNFFVLAFQDTEILLIALLLWYGLRHFSQFAFAARLGIYCSLLITAYYGARELADHILAPKFGMDDHSQMAVLLCCQAYILCRYYRAPVDRLVSVAVYIASFFTLSRLPVFFAPAILLGFVGRSRVAMMMVALATAAACYLFIVAADAIRQVFAVYDRLSSVEAVTSSGSTTAHLLLLKSAWEIKFSDLGAFLLGTGPGNFSKALISFSPAPLAQLASLDPTLVIGARSGIAPMHSVPMQVLLDYNIVFFFLFAFVVLSIMRYLLRVHALTDLVFFLGILCASSFYSLHNKPYFYLLLCTTAIFIIARHLPQRAAFPGWRPGFPRLPAH